MDEKQIKDRITNLCKRSFENDLEVLIFKKIISKENINNYPIKILELEDIYLDQETYKIYRKSYQKNDDNIVVNGEKFSLKGIDDKMIEYYPCKDNRKRLFDNYVKIFKEKNENEIKKLFNTYSKDNTLACEYCGITEGIINQALSDEKLDNFYTIRFFYNRGRTMEIDRKYPNRGYVPGNMVLSCYWCNNAKSDEFEYEEFKEIIAPGIRKIWEMRFKKYFQSTNN